MTRRNKLVQNLNKTYTDCKTDKQDNNIFQAEDGIRDGHETGVQTCALPILPWRGRSRVFEPHSEASATPNTRFLSSPSLSRAFAASSNSRFFACSSIFFSSASISRAICFSDRKSTRLNSSHVAISYAVFFLK